MPQATEAHSLGDSLVSLFRGGFGCLLTFAEAVTQGHTRIEDEALTAPQALILGNFFKVFQDAALEMVNLLEALGEQVGAGFFAPNAAGAEHRDFSCALGIERPAGKICKFAPKRVMFGSTAPRTRSHFDLELVAGVDQEDVRLLDELIPVRGIDINADTWHSDRCPGRQW